MLKSCVFVVLGAASVALVACGSDDGGGGRSAADGGGAAGAATGGTGGGGGGAAGGGGASTGGASTGGASGGGGATTGGAPGSDASAGAGGDGAAGSTGDGGPPADAGTPCEQLAACCTPGPFEPSCQQIASQGQDLQCTTVMGLFCMGGLEGGAPSDAGTGCTGLDACCDQLSGIQQTQCQAIVGTGNDMQCDTVAFVFCP